MTLEFFFVSSLVDSFLLFVLQLDQPYFFVYRRKCAACGCPSSGHMTHPSHVNKVISYLFNDNTPQQTTSSSTTTTNTNSDTQGLVASVTSVVPNSHGVLPGVAGSIPGGVGSIPGGVGSGVGSTGGGNKLSISSLSDTDSGCYVMDEYAWVPPGLNPKQVCEKEHDFYEVRGQVR